MTAKQEQEQKGWGKEYLEKQLASLWLEACMGLPPASINMFRGAVQDFRTATWQFLRAARSAQIGELLKVCQDRGWLVISDGEITIEERWVENLVGELSQLANGEKFPMTNPIAGAIVNSYRSMLIHGAPF